MTLVRHIFLLLTIILTLKTTGQNKRYVEEVALYHLDSLTKINSQFKNFKYFTNGYLADLQSYVDTTKYINVRQHYVIKSSFKNLEIIEDPKVIFFSVPRRIRKNGSSTDLDIFRYVKIKDKYYVRFGVKTDNYSGQAALIIMDSKGDLISWDYSTWIE